jgi:hypothetical protein
MCISSFVLNVKLILDYQSYYIKKHDGWEM